MKNHFKLRTAAGLVCLGLVMQTSAYLPASAEAKSGMTINEVCSKNTSYDTGSGQFFDWIELYNGGSSAADLSGWGALRQSRQALSLGGAA